MAGSSVMRAVSRGMSAASIFVAMMFFQVVQ